MKKTIETIAIEMIKAQATAIMNEKENAWIDSPEKLLIATLYKLTKDGHISNIK